MQPQIHDLFTAYKTGKTDRRSFLKKLTIYAGSTAAAIVLLSELEDNGAKASESHADTAITSGLVDYQGKTGPMKAYYSHPDKKKKFPAVLIIHENRGLQPHIMDVTRRMAAEGFFALAPDALTPLGGTPENDINKAVSMIQSLNMEDTIANFVAAVAYLKTNPLTTGKVGCTGFCWGGAMTNQVAVHTPELNAAVPYYGRQPDPADVPKIKAALMAHYASDDPRINEGIPAFEEALKKAGIAYQIFMYQGTKHAFNNDTNPERYNEEAAKLAWSRTIAFFREKLK